mgnify:CR=1 FL=1
MEVLYVAVCADEDACAALAHALCATFIVGSSVIGAATETIRHVFAMREVLTPEQKQVFDNTVVSALTTEQQ